MTVNYSARNLEKILSRANRKHRGSWKFLFLTTQLRRAHKITINKMARTHEDSIAIIQVNSHLPKHSHLLVAYVLCAHGSCLGKSPPQTLVLLRPIAVSQQEEFGAYMEETKE